MKKDLSYWRSEEGLDQIRAWTEEGIVNRTLAAKMGVSARGLVNWRNKYPEIMDAMKAGKAYADEDVERSMYEKALGYKTRERTWERVNGKLVVTKVVEKDVPPDTGAMIFWLRNRMPNEWTNKERVDKELAQARKDLIETKTKLLKGAENDFSLMNKLLEVFQDED